MIANVINAEVKARYLRKMSNIHIYRTGFVPVQEGVEMGWAARNRGTYKERKAKAIKRDRIVTNTRKIKELNRIALMTPEERSKDRHIRSLMAMATK